jgi:putative resolvase
MIFRGLLRLVREDQAAAIVVTYPDRLTRFGQEYLQALLDSFGATLTELDPGEDKTAEQELTDDMLALLLHLTASSSPGNPSHR